MKGRQEVSTLFPLCYLQPEHIDNIADSLSIRQILICRL